MARSAKAERTVHVPKGQTLTVVCDSKKQIVVTRFPSGAVQVRDGATNHQLRAWAPK